MYQRFLYASGISSSGRSRRFGNPIKEVYSISRLHVLLINGHVLLAGARSVYRSVDDIEKNARVYDGEGRCIRSFCLGDGIQDLYVTPKNTIWTSYSDEGVYGNFGWDEPIGSKGLIHWDAFGEQLEWHGPEGQYYKIE